MNNSKESWKVLLVIVGLAAMLLVAGCGGSDDAAAPEPAGDAAADEAPDVPEAADAPQVDGERYETDTVSMVIADGWDVMDISGGLQAYKGNVAAVEVSIRGSGNSDDAGKIAMEKFSEDYDGTMVMEIDLLGYTFYHTYYEYMGMEQSKMNAVKDGAIISIGVTGPDHEDDEEIAGMIYSIIFN